ncbi:hypothetical protein SKAU_G00230870 [Synaphobranchus kaupii]|uniref:Gypsy retrotransposon integrase-like protein 1 n=1 Tax=Synaphobranchus kaupii TaxID=118154 RepID=A0A9Q1ITB8_SYNKA|nr:hypothetical protein SKAU_G00230870 [Synaphobranchus kaupii]
MRFYWPGVKKAVEDYCRSCPDCQQVAPRPHLRSPLIPLPIISVPFSRIGMDLVGPLPRSSRGHQYILVVLDYATRYPEAIPLRTMATKGIARELMLLFSRVGLPEEILTDQGTPFMSEIMRDLCQLMKAPTGFSPFELLYGRRPQGLLDLAKEAWEQQPSPHRTMVEHVEEVRERMATIWPMVREHMAEAQTAQARVYNRGAQPREFGPGDKVLVLVPTLECKFLAKWNGPYEVIEKVGTVTTGYDSPDDDPPLRSGAAHGNADALSRRDALGSWAAPPSQSELRGAVCGSRRGRNHACSLSRITFLVKRRGKLLWEETINRKGRSVDLTPLSDAMNLKWRFSQ